jgi:hypothetical protein
MLALWELAKRSFSVLNNKWFPKIFVVGFLFIRCITMYREHKSISDILTTIAKEIFTAEVQIRDVVNSAIANNGTYTLWSVVTIINSLLLMYLIVNFIANALTGTGMYGDYMTVMWGLLVLVILEFSVARFTGAATDFVPVRDGIWHMLMNLHPLVYNIKVF